MISHTSSVLAPTPVPEITKDTIKKKDIVYFMDRMTNLASLAEDHPDEKIILCSSFDPAKSMEKNNGFLKTEMIDNKPWNILVDENGPGCVSRIWINSKSEGNIRIILDQQEQPVVDTAISSFFSGQYQIFSQPYVFDNQELQCGGNISYLPIPFNKHCRILTDSLSKDFKYQIAIRKFSPDTDIVTYAPEKNNAIANDIANAKKPFEVNAVSRFQKISKKTNTVTLPPKSRQMVQSVIGPNAIDYLEMQLDNYDYAILNQIHLEIYWDNMSDAAVSCSLTDFFDDNGLNTSWNFYPMGRLNEEKYKCFYSQFYMPFKEKAQIFIENKNQAPLTLTLNYHTSPNPIPPSFLYFYAQAKERTMPAGYLFTMFDYTGKGNFIGTKWSTFARSSAGSVLLLGRQQLFL